MRLGTILVSLPVHTHLGRKANSKKLLPMGVAGLAIMILVYMGVS